MADQNIKDILVASTIFVFLIVGGVALLNIFSNVDDSYINEGNYTYFNKSFNKFEELDAGIQTLESRINDNSTGLTGDNDFDLWDNIIFKGWSAVTSVGKLFSFAFSSSSSMFAGLTDSTFGVPNWIVSIITSILTILLIWAVIAIILRLR